MLTGLTSISFRQLTADEIIALTVKAGLDGIEWGGDVHIPPASPKLAALVAEKTRAAGLKVLSYGSYWRCDDPAAFDGILESAKALGAPIIRVWAGSKTIDEITGGEFDSILLNVRTAAEKAAACGIGIAFEYHRGTLTQTKEGAVWLLEHLPMENVTTYWQPNPDITFEEQLQEIDDVKDRLSYLHVFAWEKGNIRFPLEHAAGKWKEYFTRAKAKAALIEFVAGDTPEQFLADAAVLKKLAAEYACEEE